MIYTIQLDNKYFPLPLQVKWLNGKLWQLITPFSYHRDNGEVITVEAGFISDFGSKPPITWLFVGSPTDEAAPAYIIHDKLCSLKPKNYSQTDFIFYEAMQKLGIAYLKRTAMYLAVKLFHILT